MVYICVTYYVLYTYLQFYYFSLLFLAPDSVCIFNIVIWFLAEGGILIFNLIWTKKVKKFLIVNLIRMKRRKDYAKDCNLHVIKMVSFAPLLKKILCLVTEDFYITKLRHNKRLILLQPLSHYLIVYEKKKKMCHLSRDCRSGWSNKFKTNSNSKVLFIFHRIILSFIWYIWYLYGSNIAPVL